MRPLGHSIHAPDNDSFYYELGENVPACQACGLVAQLDWLNPAFELKHTKYGVSYTYDSALSVSARFVRFAHAYAGARFLGLPSAPGFGCLSWTRLSHWTAIAAFAWSKLRVPYAEGSARS
jgi:hypothetical protein